MENPPQAMRKGAMAKGVRFVERSVTAMRTALKPRNASEAVPLEPLQFPELMLLRPDKRIAAVRLSDGTEVTTKTVVNAAGQELCLVKVALSDAARGAWGGKVLMPRCSADSEKM